MYTISNLEKKVKIKKTLYKKNVWALLLTTACFSTFPFLSAIFILMPKLSSLSTFIIFMSRLSALPFPSTISIPKLSTPPSPFTLLLFGLLTSTSTVFVTIPWLSAFLSTFVIFLLELFAFLSLSTISIPRLSVFLFLFSILILKPRLYLPPFFIWFFLQISILISKSQRLD